MGHIHEKYDFTVGCFIVFENKVLLVNHPRYDMWLGPGEIRHFAKRAIKAAA